jgi:hypothetical protein
MPIAIDSGGEFASMYASAPEIAFADFACKRFNIAGR